MWRPLPFERPEDLEMVYVKAPALAPGIYPFSAADVLDFQEHTRSHTAVAAFQSTSHDLSGAGDPFRVEGARATPSLFPLLAGPTAALVPAVRAQVGLLDPELVIRRLLPVPELVHESLARERFRTRLLLAFAVTALLLAAIGIAGVTGVAVTQRQHEIGLRMALGADRGHVLREVLGGGLRLVLAGVAVGLAGGLALSRLVASLLYGVTATNPVTFAAAAALLLATGLLATYFPARRAAAVDPMVALRQE